MNISHSPAIAITFRCNCSQPLHARTIGFLADWISAYVYIKGNKERLVLYFLVSFLGTFLTIFLVLSIRLYVQKRRAIRLLKETATLVSPISEISYEVHRDTTLDPLEISVPTSQTTLNHGHHQHQHSLHHHHRQHSNHPSSRLPSTLTSVVTGTGGGHTQTHLDSQYQPLLTSPRHHHHRSSSRQNSPQTSHSVSQSPQQSPQRLSLLQPDSSQLNSSSSPQPNTSINSSNNTNGNNSNLIVNSSNENSPVNNVDNLITPSIDESQRLYTSVPSSSQRRSTRESSSPQTINSTPSTDHNNSPRSASIGSNNQPNQRANSITRRQQQSNEMIIGYS